MRRLLGILVLSATLLAAGAQWASDAANSWRLPTVSWIFELGGDAAQPWLGWLLAAACVVPGLWLVWRREFQWTPITARRWQRFASIPRGRWSLRLLLVLVGFACLDQIVAGRRALVVRYDGHTHFPAFRKEIHVASQFGQAGQGEADYRALRESLREEKAGTGKSRGWVLMPLIPWSATFDTEDNVAVPLQERDGLLRDPRGRPYFGLAQRFHPENPGLRVRQARFRDGRLHLNDDWFDADGNVVLSADWDHGRKTREREIGGPEAAAAARATPQGPWTRIDYRPIPPNLGRGHFLGTDSRGWDVAAQLYGGLQVVLRAAALYLAVTYLVGISLGLLMGFLGGTFDIIAQRLIEIFHSIPFLYLVIILVSILDRDNITLPLLIGILCLFSWIGCSTYMRSATYREKARDYVAAARVLGAGAGRIIFRHILPNTLSVLVTLVPFSVTGIATSLTALDFIGFGLPERFPSWGRLLSDGVEYLHTAPWIVASVFVMLVTLLLLITFVGEALREAFDPKKFTTYR
jgi:microcin C transport system permease protein